jgi:ribosomal protein S18 acetylase RimI-like enzyme
MKQRDTSEEYVVQVRQTASADIPSIIELCRAVYPESAPWTREQLESHLRIFPEGQLVAEEQPSKRIVGMAASLIVLWDDYETSMAWRDFTAAGFFTNHDPENGRTLYGAEIMVHPAYQGHGVGKKLYEARRNLARKFGLLRIRAGARLRGYHRFAGELTPEQYVIHVVRGDIADATLTFQLRQGFRVIAVVNGYLQHDPESLGYAAVIEWLNRRVARAIRYESPPSRFHPA